MQIRSDEEHLLEDNETDAFIHSFNYFYFHCNTNTKEHYIISPTLSYLFLFDVFQGFVLCVCMCACLSHHLHKRFHVFLKSLR
jgi:hypothetical protein